MRIAERLARYAVALVAVAAATAGRLALGPALGPLFPFATLFLAVLVSAGFGGLGPGLLATFLGLLASAYYLLAPIGSLAVARSEDQLGLVLFAAVSFGITLLGAALRSAHERALELAARVSRDTEQLRTTLAGLGDGKAAQRLLASIVENSQDAIYGKDLRGAITSWNAGAERLFGYRPEEVVGKPSAMLTPADRLAEQSAILVVERDSAEPFETVRRRKDGSLVQVSMSISPVRDAAGAVVGSSTIARDITAQKVVEDELRRARDDLRESDRRKDEFLAILAHELRNPLAPLRNALVILQKAVPGSALAADSRDMAERQVHHLARLVDDLLDVSRITHNRVVLQKERLELAAGIARALETAMPVIEAQGHELRVELPSAPVFIEADVVRFAQIVANLLNNAAQYTTPGGKITLAAEARDGWASIRVSDTGLGIAADALPRIFDMFTQVSPREARAPHSLGIGLRLVKGLVEMHGGRIEARSAGLGHGSAFVVHLPLAEGVGPEPATPVAPRPAPTRRRILVVDDNVDAATSLATLLELEGHEARMAFSGAAALEAVEAQAPELVFLDIGMPDLDGYEVARRIRARPGAAPIMLVALTGWGQEHDLRRAKEAGFDHHLTKPVEPAALLAVVGGATPV